MSSSVQGPATWTFAQLSDPHLSSLNGVGLGSLLNKRLLGYLSWKFRRQKEHTRDVLSVLVRDLRTLSPDHVVITGDLTHVGLPEEFREARAWLDSLGPPTGVTVVPGNHDAYVSEDWGRTFALWAPYMSSDGPSSPAPSGDSLSGTFPSVRIRGKAALIGLSTARPSAPFLAVGSVGPDQLVRLQRILHETALQNLCRILLLHHPPSPVPIAWRKRLTDSPGLRAVLEQEGAELVLHGHTHKTSVAQLETSRGSIPTIGVPSASALGRTPERRAQYHLYHITPTQQGWDVLVTVRGYHATEGQFRAESEHRLVIRR